MPGEELTAYVPRVVVEWALEDPAARARRLDGTMAFVDISGFTAMSEQLASKGKAGAEEVTDVMNATFARLLEVAYAHGGGLLKFGGDALLLFYSGADHAPRAARAAFGMRATLAEIGRLETSAGSVELRMHVGIHSGAFDFFLVGESHRELIVAGPAATRTVQMEAASEAGEILLSPESAALLDDAVVGAAKDGGLLLASEPSTTGALEPLPSTEGLELETFVPLGVRAHVATPAAEGEHRAAAVAFVRFGGVDGLLADGDGAPAETAVEELVGAVQSACEEHDVCFLESDVDQDGGRIVLVAGAPVASENDEERMLRTVRAIVERPTTLEVQIGVNRGRVFAGEVGAPFRRTYTILGDTAALAARLMARAAPGQVLVASDVLPRSRTAFAALELEPFHVKGKAEPVQAVELGPVVGTRETTGQERLPMVDRERELAVLSAAIGPARSGFGTLAELIGEPGIGKSRLVEEVRAQADDLAPVATACEQYEATTPYFAFRELIRRLLEVPLGAEPSANTEALRRRLGSLAPDLVPWIPLLGLALDAPVESTPEVDDLQPAFRRARLHGAVTDLLAALLASPTMLLFEDVHWMDEASAELLRHLALQLQGKPWFACTTRRPVAGGFSAAEGTPPVPAFTIRLDPLPEEDARKLAASAAGDDVVTADELAAIAERAGGNPLFLQELVTAHRAQAEGAEELPDTVEALVGARIDRLSAPDRALLRWASVLGPSFGSDALELVLAGDPSAASDSEAWDRLAEFVERDPNVAGGYRFRHALFRDAAYEGLPYRRRRELHARVGEAYERLRGDEAEDLPETLSLHFLRAEVYDKAWSYSLAAAERARAKSANVDAAEFYRRALDARRGVTVSDDEVADVWEALGDVCELAGQYEDAGHAYREAAHVARSPAREPGLLLKQGSVREREGDYPGALRLYTRGRTATKRVHDAAERTRALVRLGLATAGVRLRQGKHDECIRWCRDVAPIAIDADDLESVAHAYYLLHLSYTSLGRPERRDFRGIALPIYEDLGDLLGQANVLNNLGIDAYYEGRWDDALEHYEQSRRLRERIGDVVGAATIVGNIAEVLSDQGRNDAARERFAEAAAVFRASNARFLEHVATANLGRLAAREGRFDDAAEALASAREGFAELDAGSFELETQARLAELDVLRGDAPERALDGARAALAAVREAGGSPLEAMLLRLVGYAHAQAGRADDARAAFLESLAAAQTAEAQYEQALAHRALADIGDDAEANATRSARLLESLGVVSVPVVPLG